MRFGFDLFRPRSLRGHLVGLVAALAIPLIALQVWWGYREAQGVEETVRAEALALADGTALSVGQFLAQTEALLTASAAEFGEIFLSGAPCDGFMRTLGNIFPFLSNVTTVDGDGTVLCSAFPFPPGTSATAWEWFPVMAADPQYVIGNPVFGTISGTWILPLVAPILDGQGRHIGAIVGSVPLLEFAASMVGNRQYDDLLITIATENRIVVARSQAAEQWVGQPLPPRRGTDESIGPGRAVARGPDFEDIDRTWGQVELANGWWVYVGVPTEAIFGPASATAARRIGTTLLILLVGILLAGRSYRRIGSALREVARGMPLTEDGRAVPLPEGTPTEFLAVVEQFNETLQSRNRAEEAQRATSERYQSIFDNAVFGLYVSTLDGRFLEVNASLVSMLGYESKRALMEAGPDSLYPSPSLRTQLVEEAVQAQAIADLEIDWVRADGMPIAVRLNGKVIRTASEEAAFEMIVEDITDEKRRENELRQTQKMEAIGKLAGGIAHDFNNLLTVIGGNIELIDDGLPDDHPLQADVDQIMEATERATSLTQQLLSFSRKDASGARRVDLNEVLTNLERMLVRLIGEDVTLDTRLASVPPHILIDPSELEQIIMNLVLNARDAMPMGGRVVIETRAAAIDVGDREDTSTVDGVLFTVRDGGLGMDAETRKRIFEPFYTTKPMGQGTGLGLSTVYGIVQRAGGHIGVESEPGHGTTIDIWFPLAVAQADHHDHSETLPSAAGGNEKVLVVEDEELVRIFVRRALEEAGYEVLTACDGQEALEIFEGLDAPVDLVLTDVVMPRMKGPELAERLATISPETPLLYMSGYIDNNAVSEALKEHPDALLRKPFSTIELCERVRVTLDRRLTSTETSAPQSSAATRSSATV